MSPNFDGISERHKSRTSRLKSISFYFGNCRTANRQVVNEHGQWQATAGISLSCVFSNELSLFVCVPTTASAGSFGQSACLRSLRSLSILSQFSLSSLFQFSLSARSQFSLYRISSLTRHWLATDLPLTVHWSLPSISVIRSALSDLPSKNYQLNTLTLHGQDLCRQRFAKEWAADSLALRIQLKNWFLSAKINCFNCCAPTVQAHRSLWQAWTRLNFFIFDDFLVD